MLTAKLRALFTFSDKNSFLIITIGNSFRSDDGVGPYIARKISKNKKNIIVLNAEDRPESIIDSAVDLRPGKVVIIDAADFNGIPGEIRIIEKKDIPNTSLSTHSFSPKIISAILEEDTGADVYFLGIQPESIQLREGLSKSVKNTAEIILSFLEKIE